MAKGMMQQCVLRRDDGATETSWIDCKFAQLNRRVGIKVNGAWEDDWTVIEVYAHKRSAEHVQEHERGWKKARERTDI